MISRSFLLGAGLAAALTTPALAAAPAPEPVPPLSVQEITEILTLIGKAPVTGNDAPEIVRLAQHLQALSAAAAAPQKPQK